MMCDAREAVEMWKNREAVSTHSHSTTTMPVALFRIERKKVANRDGLCYG